MNGTEFEQFLASVIKEYGSSYIDEKTIDKTPHKFSVEFERKMNILMGKAKKNIRITPKKLFAAIIAALLAAVIFAMSVSAIREAFINFFMEIFDTHTNVQSASTDDAPLEFVDIYEITADMSEYDLAKFSENIIEREYVYEGEQGKIYFRQYIKQYYDIAVNTEGHTLENIYINGFEGYYIDMFNLNVKVVSWDNGDYILYLLVSCNEGYDISKDRLIEIANSVQKVEK